MSSPTVNVRKDIEQNSSLSMLLEYIRHNSDSFINWKKYIPKES